MNNSLPILLILLFSGCYTAGNIPDESAAGWNYRVEYDDLDQSRRHWITKGSVRVMYNEKLDTPYIFVGWESIPDIRTGRMRIGNQQFDSTHTFGWDIVEAMQQAKQIVYTNVYQHYSNYDYYTSDTLYADITGFNAAWNYLMDNVN